MDSNKEWVEQNLMRQRKMLEERQRQRRIQSAAPIRSNLGSATSASSNFSLRNPVQRSDDFASNLFNEVEIPGGLASDNGTSATNGTNAGGGSVGSNANVSGVGHSATTSAAAVAVHSSNTLAAPTQTGYMSTSRSMPLSQSLQRMASPTQSASSMETLIPPINATRLDKSAAAEDDSPSGEEGHAVVEVQVRPWHEEADLEEGVIENAPQIDVAKVLTDLPAFVIEPCVRHTLMRCTITRDKKGMQKGWYPSYYLHWERTHDKKHLLLAARRRKKCVTGSYIISTDPTELSRDDGSCVGKVRANALGTIFTVFDNGRNPKKSGAASGGDLRKELGCVIYEPNMFGFKGPRKMTIILPGVGANGERTEIRPTTERESLAERWKINDTEGLTVMKNKAPLWNEETQSFVLNFRGRVTQASVKNFQIVLDDEQEYVVMQFGRINESAFTLDFRFPLSPVQAFGIAMSSFHSKLACE